MIRSLLLGLVVLIVAASSAGALYQWIQSRSDAQRFPPPGRLVAVNDLEMHVDCRGSGRPVVIMEAGLTTGSWSWGTVFDAIAEQTEVCAYDRPGMGWSEPLGRLADAGDVARRLHALIRLAGIEGPYVLLGMSAGGVYVREYYRRYPDGVVGMVLIDSSHEQQGDRLPPVEGEEDFARIVRVCSWLQPLGLVRALDAMDVMLENQAPIPEDARALLRSRVDQSHYCAALLDEVRSFEAEVHDPTPPASLGDLPLLVFSQGNEPQGSEPFGLSEAQARAQRKVWDVLQEELAALSTRGERRVAERSGHVIQLEQPEIVIDGVTELLEDLRRAARP